MREPLETLDDQALEGLASDLVSAVIRTGGIGDVDLVMRKILEEAARRTRTREAGPLPARIAMAVRAAEVVINEAQGDEVPDDKGLGELLLHVRGALDELGSRARRLAKL